MPKKESTPPPSTPSTPDKSKGESAPMIGGNMFTAGVGSMGFLASATAMAYGTMMFDVESKIAEAMAKIAPNAEPMALPMLAGVFHIFILQCVHEKFRAHAHHILFSLLVEPAAVLSLP